MVLRGTLVANEFANTHVDIGRVVEFGGQRVLRLLPALEYAELTALRFVFIQPGRASERGEHIMDVLEFELPFGEKGLGSGSEAQNLIGLVVKDHSLILEDVDLTGEVDPI